MVYIVSALKPEAQAFIDKYRLKKESLGAYKIFRDKNITLIISGVGVDKARLATQALINQFDITDEDIYLNIGICGANDRYKIGELIEISKIKYKEQMYELNDDTKNEIYCSDEEIAEIKYDIVDMESFGFYDAVTHSTAIKRKYILKVVSDHFEPKKVTKEVTKALLFNKIDDINKIIFQ